MKDKLFSLICFTALWGANLQAELVIDNRPTRPPSPPSRPSGEIVTPSTPEQPNTPKSSCVVINLVDGSRILGQPQFDKIPLKTSLGDISVPLEKLASIQWKRGATNAEVKLQNGDKLSGEVTLNSLKMSTCIGVLTLKVADLTSLSVEAQPPAK